MTTTTTAPRTRADWVPYVAIAAGGLLLLKAVLIIGSEDSLPDGPMAGMYLGGLLLAVAAAIGVGLHQRRGRRTLVAVGLVVALVVYVIGLSDATVGQLFAAMSDAPWVGDEGPIGVLGAVLLLLGARARA